jgi:hypothetical protein
MISKPFVYKSNSSYTHGRTKEQPCKAIISANTVTEFKMSNVEEQPCKAIISANTVTEFKMSDVAASVPQSNFRNFMSHIFLL